MKGKHLVFALLIPLTFNMLVPPRSAHAVEPVTITAVTAGVILIKGTKAAIAIGSAAASKYLFTQGIRGEYKRMEDWQAQKMLDRVSSMTADEIYDECHRVGGGMVNTFDIRENSWGDKLIFGVHKAEYAQRGQPYGGWACVAP